MPKSNFLYCVEREYPVSISTLWNAWTDSEALQSWYCGTEFTVVANSAYSDPVVDGWWTVGVDVAKFGFNAYFYGKYQDVIHHKRLTHTLYYTQVKSKFLARDLTAEHHLIEIEFEARHGSSWVKFSQFGTLPDGEAQQAQVGMESYFDNLSKFLAHIKN